MILKFIKLFKLFLFRTFLKLLLAAIIVFIRRVT